MSNQRTVLSPGYPGTEVRITDFYNNNIVEFDSHDTGASVRNKANVNHLRVTNAPFGEGPLMEAVSPEANVDINLTPKGTGALVVKNITTGSAVSGGSLKADTIEEVTAANGVIVDGVLLKDSQVNTDVINEKTTDAGVLVDGCWMKDNRVGVGAITASTNGPDADFHALSSGAVRLFMEGNTNSSANEGSHAEFTCGSAHWFSRATHDADTKFDSYGSGGTMRPFVFRTGGTHTKSAYALPAETVAPTTRLTIDADVTVDNGNLIVAASNTLTADTLAETTSAAGVTVEGVVVKDSYVTATNSSVSGGFALTNRFQRGDSTFEPGWIAATIGPASGGGDQLVMGYLMGARIAAQNSAFSAWEDIHVGRTVAGADTLLHGAQVSCDATTGMAITTATASTSQTTGALRVTGGIATQDQVTCNSLSFNGTDTVGTIVNETVFDFDPTTTGAANIAGTLGLGTDTNFYTRLGDTVTFHFEVTGATVTAGGTTTVLPFTLPVAAAYTVMSLGSAGVFTTGNGWVTASVLNLAGSASIRWDSHASDSTSAANIYVSGTYVV